MPRIFDNIENKLLPTLLETLNIADHAYFFVGSGNLVFGASYLMPDGLVV